MRHGHNGYIDMGCLASAGPYTSCNRLAVLKAEEGLQACAHLTYLAQHHVQ
jgi:hypothetical protein